VKVPNKFEIRREATRRELIRLGLERFPEKGYTGTTIDDIVRGSRLTRGAFYFHFADKEDFFLAIMAARAERRGDWASLARDESLTTLEEVVDKGLGILHLLGAEFGAWVIALADFMQAHRTDEYADRAKGVQQLWITEVGTWAAIMQERGLVRTDWSAEDLALALFVHVEGHSMHARVYGELSPMAVDSLLRILRP
jgi:AcrR family transcriptional regulator